MAAVTTLPATFVAGDVLTAAQMNNLRGAFRVLQVVNASTTTLVSNSTNAYVDTGLTATITPSSTSSQILVFVSQNGVYKTNGNAGNRVDINLVRGATQISILCADVCYTNTALELAVPSASARRSRPAAAPRSDRRSGRRRADRA